MDPISSTAGLVAGVTSIVTVIGKSVQTLNGIRQRYKDAELNILLLTGHLRTVRTALLQVQHWVTQCLHGVAHHHQLMVELEEAIDHCRLLVEHIDLQISRFEWEEGNPLRMGSKALLILEDQLIKDCLTRLDHQINALNLCLTAFKCRTPLEQQVLLNREDSTSVLNQARDDATSLAGVRDSVSFNHSSFRASVDTQISKTFDFDDLLLRHKIYQSSFRSIIRHVISSTEKRTRAKEHQRVSSDSPVFQLKSTAHDSAIIDSKIESDARKLSKEVKILAFGEKHGRSAIIKQMRYIHGRPFSDTEVETYRRSITSLVIAVVMVILDYIKGSGIGLVGYMSKEHADAIRAFSESGRPEWRLDTDTATSVTYIWQNWRVRQAYSAMQQHSHTAYFLNAITRICQPDYIPTNMDIIRAPETVETMKETQLTLDMSTVRIIEIKEHQTMKILPQFADVQFCLFAIDLTCYDRHLDDPAHTNCLRDRFQHLQGICRLPYFRKTIILLFLTNAAAFEKQAIRSSPTRHLEDYTGADDTGAFTKYILKQCRKANRSNLPLFWHVYDCAVDGAAAQSTDHFFKQAAASTPAVSWLREFGPSF